MDDETVNLVNDSLRTRVLAVWPDVALANGNDNGVWFAEDVKSIPFEMFKLPFAVVVGEDWEPREDFGITHQVSLAPYMIHYVRGKNQTNRTLRSRIKALANYLAKTENDVYNTVATENVAAQILGVTTISGGHELPLNTEFIERNMGHRASAVRVELLVTESWA